MLKEFVVTFNNGASITVHSLTWDKAAQEGLAFISYLGNKVTLAVVNIYFTGKII